MTEEKLTTEHMLKILGICECQRFGDNFRSILISIRDKTKAQYDNVEDEPFTSEEKFIIALLDRRLVKVNDNDSGGTLIVHGINIEYPILQYNEYFWDKL